MRMLGSLRSVAVVAALVLSSAASAETKLDMAFYDPEGSPLAAPYKEWIADVAKATEGRVVITPHFSNSLVKMTELPDAIQNGVVPMGVSAPPFLSGMIPALAYLEIVGTFAPDPKVAGQMLVELEPHINTLLLERGMRMLWGTPLVGVSYSCGSTFLKAPGDWSGIKIRTAGRWQAAQMETLGAVPTRIDPSEQYVALQTKAIDCAAGYSTMISDNKFYEVAPKVTSSHLSGSMNLVVISDSVWQEISESDRAIIQKLSSEAMAKSAERISKLQDDAVAKMKDAGADVSQLTDEEVAHVRSTIKTVYDKIGDQGGEAGAAIRDIVLGKI